MVMIKKQLVSTSTINSHSYGYGNPVNYITIHQTGNSNPGADAQAHANIQSNGNTRSASWHYSVDDKEVIQSFPDSVKCWHATDGRYGTGNNESISIEICINSDGDYVQAVQNGAELVKQKMDEYGLGINRIKQHHDWYNKNCPAQIRAGKAGVYWDDFLDTVQGEKVEAAPESKEKSHSTGSNWTKVTGNWTGQTLGSGEYGKPVRQLQNKLASNDPPFYPNKGAKNNGVDSYYGANTEDAVTRYQSYYGLVVDGLAGKEVYKSLTGNESSGGGSKSQSSGNLPDGVLNTGDRGSDVRKVQEALASVYFYPNKDAKNNGIDGIYGPNTKDAVRRFQSVHGLTQDGIYGPSTKKALLKAM